MKRAIFFAIIAALLLVPWGVASAYGRANAAEASASIVAADPSRVPSIHVFGNAYGRISAGELFTVDISGSANDGKFTLALSNTNELVNYFRYISMNIGLYASTDNVTWEKVTGVTGDLTPLFITMQGGELSFTLPGNAKYKVTVESGSYHSFSIKPGEKAAIPQFSLSSG